jgi:hypothetical protein
MRITRKIDTTKATYQLSEINEREFNLLLHSLVRCKKAGGFGLSLEGDPVGDLIEKFEKMKSSEVTTIA